MLKHEIASTLRRNHAMVLCLNNRKKILLWFTAMDLVMMAPIGVSTLELRALRRAPQSVSTEAGARSSRARILHCDQR